MAIQAALVTGSLVSMDNAFARHIVDHGHGGSEGGLRIFFIAGVDCLDSVLDMSTQLGTQAGVVLTALFSLTGTFFSLCRVSQVGLLKNS